MVQINHQILQVKYQEVLTGYNIVQIGFQVVHGTNRSKSSTKCAIKKVQIGHQIVQIYYDSTDWPPNNTPNTKMVQFDYLVVETEN